MTNDKLLSNIENSDDAKQKRSKIWDKMNEMIQLRKSEKRDFTDEEKTKYEQLRSDFDILTETLKELEADEKRALIMAGNQANEQRKSQDERDLAKFSLARLIQLKSEGRSLDGIEAEMHQEAEQEARRSGVSLSGVGVPNVAIDSIMKRSQSSMNATGGSGGDEGGMLVPTSTSGLIMALRPMLVLSQLGVNMMGGLVGNLDFVKGTSTVASWNTETGEAANTNIGTSKISMSPKRLAAYTEIYKQLMVQTPENIEQKIMGDLLRAVAQAVEAAAINGADGGNDPTGILNVTGIGSVVGGAEGAVPTWDHLVALEKEVAIENALMGRLAYLTNHKVKAKLKTTKMDAGSGVFVWPHNENNINGYPVGVSNLVPSNLEKTATDLSAIIFGDWSELMIGQWGGLDLIVDPYSGAKNNKIVITTNSFWDVQTLWPEKFAAMTDAITGAVDESDDD
jgi:HK97 family phage major capsid protein